MSPNPNPNQNQNQNQNPNSFKNFNKTLQAALATAGFSEKEIAHGAIMAEMQAALKLVTNPLAAFAISSTFSKALAVLSVADDVKPERICAASDLIFDSAMAHAKEMMAEEPAPAKEVKTVN